MILIARNWWSLVLRGVVALIFGVLAFALPSITLQILVLWFGVYAFVDGVVNLVGAFQASRHHQRWGAFVIEGILGVAAGLFAWFLPGFTALALIYLIAGWSILTGVLEIAAAIQLRKHITGEWLLALAGVVSILFGATIIAVPMAGAVAIAFFVGVYALIFGATLIGLGLRLRHWHGRQTSGLQARAAGA